MFNAIEGHAGPVRILKRAVANKTLAHAYLFSGDEGIGKKMTALALAAAVNCREGGPEGGCGSCPSCRKVAALVHPDVHVLTPDGEDIKIDQVRQMQADLSLKPFEGEKKVLIIDGAERMNPAASNAFLKTLEEPPGEAVIILITAMSQGLLATIRSRCQEIRFQPLPRNTLARALMQRRGLSEGDAWFLAALARGSMGRGLAMDPDGEKAVREQVITLLAGAASMGPGEAVAQAEALSKDRERFERLLEIGVEWLRDALVYRATGEKRLLVYGGGPDVSADGRAITKLVAWIELFFASRALLDRRVSAQLVAENLLLKMSEG